MQLSEFDYDLPPELIAQRPLAQRDLARLLVVDRRKKNFQHDVFKNLSRHLPPRSLLVFNDSKVIPARLLARRQTGGNVEVFLLKQYSSDDPCVYEALINPLGRLKINEVLLFPGSRLTAELIDPKKKLVRFNVPDVLKYAERVGHMPLPPYIKRTDDRRDRARYQTVYAKVPGSVAAPTAGLHFTRALLNRLQKAGHRQERVTLHVNAGTFKPVTAANIRDHEMHSETFNLPVAAWRRIQSVRLQGRAVVAVGTTSCRVLESVGRSGALRGETNIFIYPGENFLATDALVTNFHLSRSTLLMLVYAFGGTELMRRAYEVAIKERYRFYSYGDAMLIL